MTGTFHLCQIFGVVSSRLLRGIRNEAVYNPDYTRDIVTWIRRERVPP